jgi:hypothetical protein
MGSKLNRYFRLSVETLEANSFAQAVGVENALPSNTSQNYIDIESPFTVEFSIERQTLARANQATFTVYNLNEATRRKIFKDPFDVTRRRAIQFWAGYESQQLSRCFNGEIRSALSVRDGTEFKTEIECYDGGFALTNGFTQMSNPAGTTKPQTIWNLMKQLPEMGKLTLGGMFSGTAPRGEVLFGNTGDLLKEVTGDNFFIDNNEAFALDRTEILPGELSQISAENGLLGTPKRADSYIEVIMLFEPRIRAGQGITLLSDTAKNFTGMYKVMGLQHRGIISGSQGGEATTTLKLWNPKKFTQVLYG